MRAVFAVVVRPLLVSVTIGLTPGIGVAQEPRVAPGAGAALGQLLPAPNRTTAQLAPIRKGDSTTQVMQALVRASGVPVVFEIDSSHPNIEQDVDLMGRTVRQSLDLFAELNPSYSWREYEGVVVVRPLTAWSDTHHLFNRSVARLSWTDVTAGNVLKNVVELVWGIPATQPPAMGSRETRTFNVDVQSGSVLTVLIAAARARGDMVWFIGTIGPRMLVLDQDSLGYRLFTEQGEFDTDPIGGMSGMSHVVKRRNERR